jgi:hypothetical protein
MKNVVFGVPAQLRWQEEHISPNRYGGMKAMDWNLGVAILYVISQSADLQHQFEIETEYSRLDHLAILAISESSLFQRWLEDQT